MVSVGNRLSASAASLRELPANASPVILMPQIEELAETNKPSISTSTVLAPAPATTDRSPFQNVFPPARQFFKRLRFTTVSQTAAASAESAPTASVLPAQHQSSVPSAQHQSGVPSAQHQASLLSAQHQASSANTHLNPIPELPDVQLHSAELIAPNIQLAPAGIEPGCDQPMEESAQQPVAPRTHKLGSRLRFPYLSSLFNK